MASSSSPPPPPLPPPQQQPQPMSSDHFDPPLGVPLLLPAPPPQTRPPSSRRLPPPCWTPDETSALIDAYRNKWYSLRRGNLRAAHWQDVADDVHRVCPNVSPPKTAVQCRHKMEKLRKRYRAELQRAKSIPHHRFSSSWVYFSKMDSMEKGDAAFSGGGGGNVTSSVSNVLVAAADDLVNYGFDDDVDDNDNANEDLDDEDYSGGSYRKDLHRNGLRIRIAGNSRKNYGGFEDNCNPNPRFASKLSTSSRYNEFGSPSNQFDDGGRYLARFMKNGSNGGGASSSGMGMGMGMGMNLTKKKRSVLGKRGRESEGGDRVAMAMVEAIQTLGEGYVRTEMSKMEIMREAERARMENELKRTELILQCHKNLVEAFVKGWSDHYVNNNDDNENNNNRDAT